jgi:hypothetical protein
MKVESNYISESILTKYTPPETSHLFFYSYDENNKIQVLLHTINSSVKCSEANKRIYNNYFNSESKQYLFKEISDKVTKMDASPIITIARLLTSKFYGLFTEKNIKNIIEEKIKLTFKDFENGQQINNYDNNLEHSDLDNKNNIVDFTKELPWYLIRNSQFLYDSIQMIKDNPIQYDLILGKKIYFIELQWINVEKLNENLREIGYPFKFKYFSTDNHYKFKIIKKI